MNRSIVPSALALAFAFLAISFVAPPTPAASARLAVDCAAEHIEGLGKACVRADGLFEVILGDGTRLLTHGPDGPEPHDLPEGDGPDGGAGIEAERAPACGTEYVQHVLYGRAANMPNNFASKKAAIQAAVRRMNSQLDLDSLASGGVHSDYRVLCDGNGAIRVDSFVAPAGTSEFGGVATAAANAGFNDPKRDYSIFWDGGSSTLCGVANFHDDPNPGVNNANNEGGDYAMTYVGCWGGRTPQHENGHNQGAVQKLAPDSDQQGHCLEGIDVMCYPTSDVIRPCTSRLFFDCDYDTYYDAAPEDGEWLDTHWNIGDRANRFILWGGVRVPEPPVLGGIAGDDQVMLSWAVPSDNGMPITGYELLRSDGQVATTTSLPPSSSFVDTNPSNGISYEFKIRAANSKGVGAWSNAVTLTPRSGNVAPTACIDVAAEWLTFTVDAACSVDSDGTLLTYGWNWGDGTADASGVTATHLYAEPGTFDITLTVMDDNGAFASVAETVTASVPPDPDPSVPNLVTGEPFAGSLAAPQDEAFMKIFVPAGRPHLRVQLDGPNCTSQGGITIACHPNMDLYVRRDAKPTDTEFDCRSMEIDSDEVCMPQAPAGGWWYVRVQLLAGASGAPFALTATY